MRFFSSLPTGNFECYCRLLIFSKSFFFLKIFQEYLHIAKQLGSDRSDILTALSDLGQNCLQRLSADATSRQSIKRQIFASTKIILGNRYNDLVYMSAFLLSSFTRLDIEIGEN